MRLSSPSSFSLGAALLGLLGVLSAAQAQTQAVAAETEARVIVRFKPAAQSVLAKPLSMRSGDTETRSIAQQRTHSLALRSGLAAGKGLQSGLSLDARTHVVKARGIDSLTLAKRLAADPEVELVAVDQLRKRALVPNDPLYPAGVAGQGPASGQWYLRAPTNEVVSSINAPAAWDRSTGSSSVIVAVLDTGIRKDHPDLAAQIVGGYDMVAYSSASSLALAIANDGNGADADASDPGDWVTQAEVDARTLGSQCTSDDVGNSSWHGTRVAGLIAATSNNGLGMAGVAWNSKILPMRVLGKCGGYDSDIIAAMRWAAGLSVPGLPANPNAARVLNLSLGGSGSCAATSSTGVLYRETISELTAMNVVVVAAAGNSAGLAVGVPGNCPNVISVTGLRHVGSKVGFSSIGPEVTLSAPGGNCVNLSGPCLYPIVSTGNSGTQGPRLADDHYTSGVGTSFSTPLVAGTVALMLAQQPSLTPAQVRSALVSTVRPFVTTGGGVTGETPPEACKAPTATEQLECYCTTSTCGAGMLDAAAAVAAVSPVVVTPPTPTPTPSAVDSGGGGGGAMSALWLLALGLAAALLRPRAARR
ncbi:MAG: peptidase [Methylibium sp.]|nr:peptidase [Methylibium sp.]